MTVGGGCTCSGVPGCGGRCGECLAERTLRAEEAVAVVLVEPDKALLLARRSGAEAGALLIKRVIQFSARSGCSRKTRRARYPVPGGPSRATARVYGSRTFTTMSAARPAPMRAVGVSSSDQTPSRRRYRTTAGGGAGCRTSAASADQERMRCRPEPPGSSAARHRSMAWPSPCGGQETASAASATMRRTGALPGRVRLTCQGWLWARRGAATALCDSPMPASSGSCRGKRLGAVDTSSAAVSSIVAARARASG